MTQPRPYAIRLATDADKDVSARLSVETFAGNGHSDTPPPPVVVDGQTMFMATPTDDPETVVAKARDRHYEAWFGGRPVATAGIASVAVAMEHRGRGVLTPLMGTMLGAARARGAVVSLLFPSAAGIYRRFGYEVIGSVDIASLPTRSLAGVRGGEDVRLTRAGVADIPALRDLYAGWAARRNATLTRTGPSFTRSDAELLTDFTGVTIAWRGEEPVGYALWDREGLYHPDGTLAVHDLVGDAGAVAALCRALATHDPVAHETRLRLSGRHPVRTLLPGGPEALTVVDTEPFMLSLLDIPGALAARGWPTGLEVDLTFEVTGSFPGEAEGAAPQAEVGGGRYRLRLAGGTAACDRLGESTAADAPAGSVPRFTAGGLARLYAGAAACGDLRESGQLTGETSTDGLWDANFSGAGPAMYDTF